MIIDTDKRNVAEVELTVRQIRTHLDDSIDSTVNDVLTNALDIAQGEVFSGGAKVYYVVIAVSQ